MRFGVAPAPGPPQVMCNFVLPSGLYLSVPSFQLRWRGQCFEIPERLF